MKIAIPLCAFIVLLGSSCAYPQGALKVEFKPGQKEVTPSIEFVYRDALGMETKREHVKLPPGQNEIKIPDGVCCIVIGEKPSVNFYISGTPMEIFVNGGNHTIQLAGNHVVEVQGAGISLVIQDVEPRINVGNLADIAVADQRGSTMVQMGDATVKLSPGDEARFNVFADKTVIEVSKVRLSVVNTQGGAAVVEEKKAATFNSEKLQKEIMITPLKTEDASAKGEMAATFVENKVTGTPPRGLGGVGMPVTTSALAISGESVRDISSQLGYQPKESVVMTQTVSEKSVLMETAVVPGYDEKTYTPVTTMVSTAFQTGPLTGDGTGSGSSKIIEDALKQSEMLLQRQEEIKKSKEQSTASPSS